VIDAYSIKPIDTVGLHDAAVATGGRIVTVEDHWAEGGLGDAVLAAFAAAGIDASAIADAIRDLVSR
jgi:transketolase